MVAAGGLLPVVAVAEIVQVDRQQYYEWRDWGLLGARIERARLSLSDAWQLASLNVLTKSLGSVKAAVAYPVIRASVIERRPGETLALAWIDADRLAAIVSSSDELLALARSGRPIKMLDLTDELNRVQDAFERELTASTRKPRSRRRT